MSKEQEALDEFVGDSRRLCDLEVFRENERKSVNILIDEDKKTLQDLIDKQVNHETELAKLNATIQNKNAVISSLSKRLKNHTSHL